MESKFNLSEEEIRRYKKDKVVCSKMIDIFKKWCKDYNLNFREDGKALQEILMAANRNGHHEQNVDCSLVARIILNKFEKRLREIRKEVVLECLEEDKEQDNYKEWYQEAAEVLEASKNTTSYLSHQDMLDKFTELFQALSMDDSVQENIADIMELYEGMDSIKFKYAYPKMVRERFNKIVAENLRKGYQGINSLEKQWNKNFQFIEGVTRYKERIQGMDIYRVKIYKYLNSIASTRLKELIDKGDEYREIYEELMERIQYFITNFRIKNYCMTSEHLPPLFSVSVMLENDDQHILFKEFKDKIKEASNLSDKEKDKIWSLFFEKIWEI